MPVHTRIRIATAIVRVVMGGGGYRGRGHVRVVIPVGAMRDFQILLGRRMPRPIGWFRVGEEEPIDVDRRGMLRVLLLVRSAPQRTRRHHR